VCEICFAHQNSPPVSILVCVSEACQTVQQRIKKPLYVHLQWWSHQWS